MPATIELLPKVIKEVPVLHRATCGHTGPRIERLQFIQTGDSISVVEFWYECGRIYRVTDRPATPDEIRSL